MFSLFTTLGCEKHTFSATALASSVASKLGSAVFSVVTSFWGSSKPAEPEKRQKPEIQLEAAQALHQHLSLEDSRRRITSILADPTGQYLASCDKFGRVMLLDAQSTTVLRMWKGYREAQCSWISVAEGEPTQSAGSSAPHPSKSSLFLVIYTQRRGILEVWPVRDGPRIAAFNIGSHCTLLYCSSGGHTRSADGATLAQALVFRATGNVDRIHIPFSCALRSISGNYLIIECLFVS